MSSFLCFICHSTVNADTNEEMREKYREIVGMNLCPDSHLCHICCHVMNRLWLFRSVCLKRSLEYPVLFSEKGTLNLQRNDLEIHTVCSDDCKHYKSRNINSKYYHFIYFDGTFDTNEKSMSRNEYVELEDERQEFDELLNNKVNYNDCNVIDSVHNSEFSDSNRDYHKKSYEEVNTSYDQENYEDLDRDCNMNGDYEEVNTNYCRLKEFKDIPTNYNQNYKEELRNYSQNKDYDEANKNSNQTKRFVDLNKEENARTNNLNQDIQEQAKRNERNADVEDERSYDDVCDVEVPNATSDDEEIYEKADNQCDVNLGTQFTGTPETVPKKKKKSKSKKKETKKFEKLILSVDEQKLELEAKRREKKYTEAEFKCYACGMGFLFKDTYQAHMMRHEESNGEYRCSICTLRFATQAVLRAHTALHAERHRCLQCAEVIRRRQRKEHSRACYNVDSDAASCHLCGRMFKDSAGLRQHLKRFHREGAGRGLSCPTCGERGAHPPALRTHMLKHLQRKFPCSECGRAFSSPYSLRAHAHRAHSHGARALAWCACGAAFAGDKGLRAHRARASTHSDTSFECSVCFRACPSARSLAAHAATHAPHATHATHATHACPACPKRYSTRKSLTRHLAVHGPTKPKLALCHLCGGSFKGNSKLNRHLREVCEKDKLEEELSSYYAQGQSDCALNTG